MKEEKIKEMKDAISALYEHPAFVQVDIGRFNGVVIIQNEDNRKSYEYMAKFAKLDELLGDMLEADILDTIISISYPYDETGNQVRIEIRFVYDD